MRRKETYHFNILTSDTNEYIVAGVPNMHTPNLKIQTQVAKHRRAANKPPKEVITLTHKNDTIFKNRNGEQMGQREIKLQSRDSTDPIISHL